MIAGPPPCTTTGFMPTYLSSTTSRANSSRSSGSSIAAPPYLITTVEPWNSRMYGSASSSVAMSRISGFPSCRVLGVDLHVVVAEVGEEQLGLGAGAGQLDLVEDLVAIHRPRQGGRVEGGRRAGLRDRDALNRDSERERRAAGQRGADRLGDPPPVGVAAEQRSLDERRVRDRAGDALDRLLPAAAHVHAGDP